MHARCQKSTWLIFFLMSRAVLAVTEDTTAKPAVTSTVNSTSDLLQTAESADPKKLDIVKQIRRLNDDGSYTVGYEAGDGTFKIESRDALGNIKGTFGYIDADGEIKRVSYSTSNNTLPIPASSTPLPPMHVNRYNKTVGSTTRRPQPTLVYPRSSSNPTRATVIQAIPRRRPSIAGSTTMPSVTTTKSYRVVTSNYMAPNRSDIIIDSASEKHTKMKMYQMDNQIKNPIEISNSPTDKPKETETTQTTETSVKVTMTSNLKPIYESLSEKELDMQKHTRGNTFRRQLASGIQENVPMIALQQSAGDDTTDVYGGSFITGTVRPLFTTTTGRPRLQPFHSILAARQRANEKNQPAVHENQDEFENRRDSENVVTSNPIPVIHIPPRREPVESRLRPQHLARQYPQITQFRSSEYLRDNPGSPIPIGNHRPVYRYNPPPQTAQETDQFLRETTLPPQNLRASTTSTTPVPAENVAPAPFTIRGPHQITRYIPVPVDERGVPIPGYQQRFFVPQHQPEPHYQDHQPQYDGHMGQIATPVSTRDLKRLLHQLIVRQQKLQQLIDLREDVVNPGPPYQPLQYRQPSQPTYSPEYQKSTQYANQGYYGPGPRPYEGNHIHNPYQYRPAYGIPPSPFPNRQEYLPQADVYNNQIANYDAPYESQRYMPRRRYYPQQQQQSQQQQRYEQQYTGESTADPVAEPPEYLPPDVREALLLKMLMLAINPEAGMATELRPEITTIMPEYKKKVGVRNVQILGEEPSNKDDLADIKRSLHMSVMRA